MKNETDPLLTAVATREPAPLAQVQATPMGMIALAIEHGAKPEDLAKLMDLQERWERNRAAEAFAEALADFQRRCPPIGKSRTALPSGKFQGYRYASYDNIMVIIRPILADCGLSVSFDAQHEAGDTAGNIGITVILKKGIHEHRTRFMCPVPRDMLVNDTQKYGAAMKYAKRYAIEAALNLVTTDEDTDARNLHDEPITEAQAITIHEMAESYGVNMPRFMQFVLERTGADSIEAIPASKHAEIFAALKERGAK